MVSSLADNDLGTSTQIVAINKWRMTIFALLHSLKERTVVEVVVRCSPYDEMELRAVGDTALGTPGDRNTFLAPRKIFGRTCEQ